ncbi:hypothetical protein CesoFtcFv8_008585 [Champsocephalus esox]|uniref:Uncharacterized protein n=2 Tax=Champsocephalus TaxID=52236 RepID=A0AAN8HWS9_CHAGU|nr:hypothetical protein CesoFtcFv8_008585 [Champsocephalus esox]KAK5926169.1 hypothetical protein CgunFtcFv8_021762 [Champsocephalus gunnari]
MLLSAFQQSPLCGSSADASSPPPSIPPFLWTGGDVGITRQEQSSQQYSDHTGTVLHVDGGEAEVMERSRSGPKA